MPNQPSDTVITFTINIEIGSETERELAEMLRCQVRHRGVSGNKHEYLLEFRDAMAADRARDGVEYWCAAYEEEDDLPNHPLIWRQRRRLIVVWMPSILPTADWLVDRLDELHIELSSRPQVEVIEEIGATVTVLMLHSATEADGVYDTIRQYELV